MEVDRCAPPACYLGRTEPLPTPLERAHHVARKNGAVARQFSWMFCLLLLALIAETCPGARAAGPSLPSAPVRRLQLRKCCGAQQQLNSDLNDCERREGEDLQDTQGFPWWLNPETPVYDEDAPARPSALAQLEVALLEAPPGLPCSSYDSKYFTWDSAKRFRLLSNGSLLLRLDDSRQIGSAGAIDDGPPASMLQLPPGEFCADVAQGYHVFLACPCNRTTCVRKCCSRSEELQVDESRWPAKAECLRSESKKSQLFWKPHFVSPNSSTSANASADAGDGVRYVLLDAKVPSCKEGMALTPVPSLSSDVEATKDPVLVLPDGRAVFRGFMGDAPFPAGVWCGDARWVPNKDEDGGVAEHFLVCMPLGAKPRSLSNLLYGSLFVVSAACLLLTLAVHALLPEMRRSTLKKATLCHVAALFCGFLALACGQLSEGLFMWASCYSVAFVAQYSMLAAFFWLNVICFDVARGFRKVHSSKRSGRRRKFLLYSLYAWGSPALVSVVTIALEFTEDLPDYVIKPEIGRDGCWFYSRAAKFAYFYGVISALLLANVVLYLSTAAHLVRARNETRTKMQNNVNTNASSPSAVSGGKAVASGSAFRRRRERVVLHLKLFLLMGVTWVMECVSVFVELDDAYWLLLDVVNILRGVFIFVLLCCKRDVWRRLCQSVRELCIDRRRTGGTGGGDVVYSDTESSSCSDSDSGSGSNSTSANGPRHRNGIPLHTLDVKEPQ